MSSLKIEVEGGGQYNLESGSDGGYILNGVEQNIDLIHLGENKYHLIRAGKSYNVELVVLEKETKSFQIKVNGRKYSLKIEDRFDQLLQKLGMDMTSSTAVSDLKAPMPGKVISVVAKAGQEVKKDEPLLILEAMKMENVLKSPSDLVLKNIVVEEGQAVEKNELLMEFET